MLTPSFVNCPLKQNNKHVSFSCFSGRNLVKTHPLALLTSQILVTMILSSSKNFKDMQLNPKRDAHSLFCELSIQTDKQTCYFSCFSGRNLVKTHPCAVLTSQILVTMTRDFHSSILQMHNFVMIRILMPQIRIGLGRGAGNMWGQGGWDFPHQILTEFPTLH